MTRHDYSMLVPYVPAEDGPEVLLLDLDGTLCLRAPFGRGPHDDSRVFEDLVNWPVLRMATAAARDGMIVVCMSGRQERCREDSQRWLDVYCPDLPVHALFMRATGDNRPDWIVKSELFDEHVRPSGAKVMAIDDRAQVVRMWRALGLTVFQVDEGDF